MEAPFFNFKISKEVWLYNLSGNFHSYNRKKKKIINFCGKKNVVDELFHNKFHILDNPFKMSLDSIFFFIYSMNFWVYRKPRQFQAEQTEYLLFSSTTWKKSAFRMRWLTG